jgi:endonuclease/exonuclease/phosphatase (EEP) superfamily protein YafD
VARLIRATLAVCLSLIMGACASLYVEQLAQVSANSRDFHLPTELGVDACRESLSAPIATDVSELDPYNIRLVNWNVQKTAAASWNEDYAELADGADLVLMQEASLREETIADLDVSRHWSFAPGYRTEEQISGVLTLSTIKPLTQCSFVVLEPVIRTPKATSITQYALATSEETLVVVNLHAVNFSLGLGAFRKQFDQVVSALSKHDGPIVLSGDFNTWRDGRMDIVDSVAAELGLTALKFMKDDRTRVRGRTIDHIYIRGLSAVRADVRTVTTSDHNPMSVTLSL